jgi:malate synthase
MKLKISEDLNNFVRDELLDGLDITPEYFWSSFEKILNEFSPRNKDLLKKRDLIQSQIDEWHISKKDTKHKHR